MSDPAQFANYIFPVQGYQGQVQNHWGEVRGGSDLFSPRGTPVVSMRGGKVIESGWNSVGGNSVLIQGDDGNQYYYAHLDNAPAVKVGQTVPSGTYLGPVGDTGDAKGKGTHLHLGIGPSIMLGADKYGGTGGNFDAVSLLQHAQSGSFSMPDNNANVSAPYKGSVSNMPMSEVIKLYQQGAQGRQAQAQAQAQPSGNSLEYNNKEQVKQYIRYAAARRGIDPEVAVKVAESEGLNTYAGDNNSSFGPFQLHYGGVAAGGNSVRGMGDSFTQATGMDARDPSTLQAQIDYSLDNAKSNGWGAWHGAARVGLANNAGIGAFSGDPGQYGDFSNISSAPASRQGGLPGQSARPLATGLPHLANNPLMSGQMQSGLPQLNAYGLPTVQMGSQLMTPFGAVSGGTGPTIPPPVVQKSTWLS